MTSQEIQDLKNTNYVRQAQASNNYWVDFSKLKLKRFYIDRFGDNFNIIIYSQPDIDTDFYIIPYQVLKNHFIDRFLSNDNAEDRKERWVLNIRNHILKVTNCPNIIDVKEYFANPYYAKNYRDEEDKNDYEIENKRQEINVRIKQSKFRRKVLENFNGKCCLSNIKEEEFLIASHIVPWKDRTTSRLDPSNGLCLFITFDKLFDKGYFTLTDEYRVITVNDLECLSKNLQNILRELNGKQINLPIKPIKLDFIRYHRTKIFIDREKE